MWIVFVISFIWYGIWQIVQVPYLFLKTAFKPFYTKKVSPYEFTVDEEAFRGGDKNISRRPVLKDPSDVVDYFLYAYKHVMKKQNDPNTLYFSYGALRYWMAQDLKLVTGYWTEDMRTVAHRHSVHENLVLPLHLFYFARVGDSLIASECSRVHEIMLKTSKRSVYDEGFDVGGEIVGFCDSINIALDGEAPTWIGYADKGIMAQAIVAVFEAKERSPAKKRKLRMIYTFLKARNIIASVYPIKENKNWLGHLIGLKASFEILMDYDNNLFYRVGYKRVLKILKESECSLQVKSTLQSNEILREHWPKKERSLMMSLINSRPFRILRAKLK